jgi:hypothetical protein
MGAPSQPAAKIAARKTRSRKWKFMSGGEKAIFVMKVIVMVCTFGFVYGNVLVD